MFHCPRLNIFYRSFLKPVRVECGGEVREEFTLDERKTGTRVERRAKADDCVPKRTKGKVIGIV